MAAIRLPAEYEPHLATVMCWPTRRSLYGELMQAAEDAHRIVAQTIAAFEPVTMIATPGSRDEVARRCGDGIEVIGLDLDDSWFRDTGPIYVDRAGELTATVWEFNGWGHKYTPIAHDATLAGRFAEDRGHRCERAPMVLEGGSITADGHGTIVTTAQCLLHANRNPDLSRAAIEEILGRHLGADTVCWLPYGLIDDDDTDGHVDNVAAWAGPGRILLQGCDDVDRPDHHRLAINRRWIENSTDAGGNPISVVEVPVLPVAEIAGRRVPVPYLNFYIGNGFVLVPTTGHPADAEMCALIGESFPGRQVIDLEVGAILAHGGGGIHCITQQIPAIGSD